jgi:hypothetical protein
VRFLITFSRLAKAPLLQTEELAKRSSISSTGGNPSAVASPLHETPGGCQMRGRFTAVYSVANVPGRSRA